MPSSRTTPRDRRVTLALKWRYLDNLEIDEIRQRFVDQGYGEYARSTIRDYLNEAPKEQVLEQIEDEQAEVRLRIIDRHERKHQRALEAELNATERDDIVAMVPKWTFNSADGPIEVPDWRELDVDEYPKDSTEHDIRIEFTGETRVVQPGEKYYVQQPNGEPDYQPKTVAVVEQPDIKQRSFLRREQSHHLEQQGEAAGVYEEDINLNMSGEMSVNINHHRVTEDDVDPDSEGGDDDS